MRKTLKLIPAVCMLLISAMLLGTTTYAWFSMNSRVTVTGMTVRTKVANNLLIAEAANGNDNSQSADMPRDEDYGTQLVQHKSALLEPVSSVSGLYDSFWYTSTTNVDSRGDAKAETYLDYDAYGLLGKAAASGSDPATPNHFNANYGLPYNAAAADDAVGYVDYVFAIQATNTDNTNTYYLNMTTCDLIYQQVATATDTTGYAFRIAVLVQDAGNNGTITSSPSVAAPTTLAILGCTDGGTEYSQYFSQVDESLTTYKAVSGAAALTAIGTDSESASLYKHAVTIDDLEPFETHYYKITIRLWLEGEDVSCTNATYAALTKDWSLDLAFQLENATTNAVTGITKSNVSSAAYTIADEASVTNGTTVVLSGVTYYEFTCTGSLGTKIYSSGADTGITSSTTAEDVTHWYIINNNDVFEVTNYTHVGS